jgi:hypothetical protein
VHALSDGVRLVGEKQIQQEPLQRNDYHQLKDDIINTNALSNDKYNKEAQFF